MRYVLTIVEQLDRAAGELETDHPINNRLAMILIDNATELILHRQCMDWLREGRFYSRLFKAEQSIATDEPMEGPTEIPEEARQYILTRKQLKQANGKFLDGKLKFLASKGNLTQPERRFVAIAHKYRDELYHVGLNHDGIIRAIASHYFFLCCNLFVRMNNLRIWGPVFSSDDRYSEVAKHYFALKEGRLDPPSVDFENLAEKLCRRLPNGLPELAESLASAARDAISEVLDSFDFLVQNNPNELEAKEILRTIQWHQDLDKALEREDVDGLWIDSEYRMGYLGVMTGRWKNWMQQYSSIPSEKWLSRANKVEQEKDPLVAMHLYQSLRDDMSYLEDAITSEAQELDRWIQIEIDRQLGK